MVKTSITLPKVLLAQVKTIAATLHISQNHLFQMAVEQFLEKYQFDLHTPERVIHQGEIYWLEEQIRHPYVIIQENVLNHSRIQTTVVCALTSNLKRAALHGNVLLDIDEANLPKQSVVEISKVSTVNKTRLGDYIGSLSEQRVNQILAGMRFLQSSFFTR